jgi:hypothetical protein
MPLGEHLLDGAGVAGTAEVDCLIDAGLAETVERATVSPFFPVRVAARLALAAEAVALPMVRLLHERCSRLAVFTEPASATTPSTLRRGLLAYSAALMAIGSGLATGIIPGPSTLALAAGRSVDGAAFVGGGHSTGRELPRTMPPGPNVAVLASPPPGTAAPTPTAPLSPATQPSAPHPLPPLGYVNPLARIANLQPKRIDQGVDYGGTGPLLAVGSGTIRLTSEAGWPGGAFIVLQLDQGQFRGQLVYYAENVTPTVRVGQHVSAGDVVGILHDAYPNLEIGWAGGGVFGGKLGDALARTEGAVNGVEGSSTAVGVNFNQFLVSLGAPGGIQQGLVGHLPIP